MRGNGSQLASTTPRIEDDGVIANDIDQHDNEGMLNRDSCTDKQLINGQAVGLGTLAGT